MSYDRRIMVEEYKLKFAGLLHRLPKELRLNPQPLLAKQVVGAEDCLKYPLYVLKIAEEWPVDPFVIAELDRLDKQPIEKEVILNDLYRIGMSTFVDPADRVKAFAEYAKIAGWTLQQKKEDRPADDRLREIAAAILNDEELAKVRIV